MVWEEFALVVNGVQSECMRFTPLHCGAIFFAELGSDDDRSPRYLYVNGCDNCKNVDVEKTYLTVCIRKTVLHANVHI